MHLQKNTLLFAFCLIISHLAQAQSNKHTYRFGFYNVENLFDIYDDPNTADEEFTPTGKKEFTQARYDEKLSHLARVVDGMNYPALLGLCEVENARVLADFAKKTSLKKHKYEYVHYDSPDFRGIDVALMYKKSCFKVLSSETIQIDFPAEIVEDYTTRDVLVVKGVFHKMDTLHVLVNHWPSRRGGLKKSSPKRVYVAQQVRKKVDAILAENSKANIILMGDFNDETDNESVAKTLNASKLTGMKSNSKDLYNAFAAQDLAGKGTYNYRGNWNMIDQIILSKNLYFDAPIQLKETVIYRQEWMMYKDKKYGETPSRSYGGSRYYGGFSDHLPIYIEVYQMTKKERKKG